MPVQKIRSSRARTHARRSQWKTSIPDLVKCPNCQSLRRAHVACPTCGYYNSRTYSKAVRSVFVEK
ncbi:MAG: 50S ribosomal protein L32 [Bifidobacteriaceae bacterium]|jgi:large subunit ribosomal protein L32|nr:50S ribosomal protein L32 [Bifidobacteriaceae bacterium]